MPTQEDLIEVVAQGAKIAKARAKKVLDLVTEFIRDATATEGKFTLPGLGTFKKGFRPGRTVAGFGVTRTIPARNSVKFKAAPIFKKRANP